MESSKNGFKGRVRRPIALDLSAIDGLAEVKLRMSRRKGNLGKQISWNDVVHELLEYYGVE